MGMRVSGYKREGMFSGERKTGIKRSSTLILYATINQGLLDIGLQGSRFKTTRQDLST
jgi:hypothetical protein